MSDLLLLVSYFAAQKKGMKFGEYFFDECCANQNWCGKKSVLSKESNTKFLQNIDFAYEVCIISFLLRCQTPTTSYSTGITTTTEKIWT